MTQELTEAITLFLRVNLNYCIENLFITHVTEFGGVVEVVGGVVFTLTELNIVELVVSSLTH